MLTGLAGRAVAWAGSRGAPEAPRTYVVERGDTVWAIAVRLSGPTVDPRPLVDEIVDLNGSDGALIPGQTLLLPRSA